MRVAIVGAGIGGLTIARQLARQGIQAVVFERGQVGGLAAGFPYPGHSGVYLEKYYHHIFTSDGRIIELIREHGLADDLLWLPSRSGLIAGGKTWPFGSALDLLRFAPLGSVFQRLRTGWNLRYFTRTEDWQHLDGVTCRQYFASRNNLAAFENLWEPLLRQKFADAHQRIPASFLWGRIFPRARSRGRGRERLGYLRGGFQRLLLAMVHAIRRDGGRVRTGEPVRRIHPGPEPEVVTPRSTERFDRVVWTAGLPAMLQTVDPRPHALADKIHGIGYIAATQLILTLRSRQTDFYWLNNLDRELSFGGLIEHTNLVPPEHYGGDHVMYVVNYHRAGDPRFFRKRTGEILEHHMPSLMRVLPGFRPDQIRRLRCIRDTYSSPLYDLRFADRIPPHQGWLENVDYCGMAQVYPMDRNMSNGAENALHYVNRCFSRPHRCGRKELPCCSSTLP